MCGGKGAEAMMSKPTSGKEIRISKKGEGCDVAISTENTQFVHLLQARAVCEFIENTYLKQQ